MLECFYFWKDFIIFTSMYICISVGMSVMCMQVPEETRGVRCLAADFTGSCEPPSVDAGN